MNQVQASQLKKGSLLKKEFENHNNLGVPSKRLELLMEGLSLLALPPKSGKRLEPSSL
jgi:hypothetical protein